MPPRSRRLNPPHPRCERSGVFTAAAASVSRCGSARCHHAGEAGIGERLRREEVPPTNDETFAGPADEPPTGSRPTGLLWCRLKRSFGVARVPSPDVRSGPPWASAHSMPPALRHPWLRWPSTPALGTRATPRQRALRRAVSSRRTGEAGIGERLRSEEVPPTNDETFAGPADESPTGPRPAGLC